jgi:hypothetical protein
MTGLEAANKALTLLGVAPVAALDADVEAARVMNRIFATSKLSVLAEFPWSFALRLDELTPAPAADIPIGWRYAWVYPPGAAALYRVFSRGRTEKIDYATANGFVFTMEPEAWAEYTDAESPVDGWPALASEAFVARLASNAAPALAGSPQLAAELLRQYTGLVEIAKGNSVNDERITKPKVTHYVDVRRG